MQYNTIQYNTIQYNTIQYTFHGPLRLSQDNRIWNMSQIYKYVKIIQRKIYIYNIHVS